MFNAFLFVVAIFSGKQTNKMLWLIFLFVWYNALVKLKHVVETPIAIETEN
jgi:hypothetical protein